MKYKEENRDLVNKVKKYIQENVHENLPLEELANFANYSPFHFQKLFKSIVGETPKQYIKRVKLENSAHYISLKSNSTILQTALKFGFSSLETFSRAFKNYYGISPDKFRISNEKQQIELLQAKIEHTMDSKVFESNKFNLNELQISVAKLPTKKMIYIPNTLKNHETVTEGFKNILNWSKTRNLINSGLETFGLLLDYPLFTSLDKCRFFSCVNVEVKPELSGEVSYMELPSKRYISFKIKGGLGEFIKQVTYINSSWLSQNGYVLDHSPAILKPLDNPTTTHQHDITYEVFLAVNPK